MAFSDLHDILVHSDSTRQYFMKLPVRVQMTIHRRNEEIKTIEELHQYADLITKR
jgi:hypothetical protein